MTYRSPVSGLDTICPAFRSRGPEPNALRTMLRVVAEEEFFMERSALSLSRRNGVPVPSGRGASHPRGHRATGTGDAFDSKCASPSGGRHASPREHDRSNRTTFSAGNTKHLTTPRAMGL